MQADVRAHALEQREEPGAGRVHPDIAQQQWLIGRQTPGDQEEGGRGEVRRHLDAGGAEALTALERERRPLADELHAEGAQHAFGVIARRPRLGEARAPRGAQGREQQR